MSAIENRIREILKEHGRLPIEVDSLRDDDDLYEYVLTSHASVNVMLALEDEFDVEFPDVMLRKGTFQSIAAMRAALVLLNPDIS
jgi:acyl carrier protein